MSKIAQSISITTIISVVINTTKMQSLGYLYLTYSSECEQCKRCNEITEKPSDRSITLCWSVHFIYLRDVLFSHSTAYTTDD